MEISIDYNLKPNSCTEKAMKDAAEGKTYKAASVDDMFKQIPG